jgi:hypothetical protein
MVAFMTSLAIERDLAVPMRDGIRLFANLFRPATDGKYPVIIPVTPYGEDKLPDRVANFFMRPSGVKFGNLNCSRLTGFESPDPVYWVQQGYAVLQAAKYPAFAHHGLVNSRVAHYFYRRALRLLPDRFSEQLQGGRHSPRAQLIDFNRGSTARALIVTPSSPGSVRIFVSGS